MDTAVAAYLLDPSVDHYRLPDLAAAHLGVELDGATGGEGQGAFALETPDTPEGDGDVPATAEGSGPDAGGAGIDAEAVRAALVLARLRAPLRAALEAVGESDLYDRIEQPLVRVLARMEVLGIPVDREVLRSIAAELAEECQSLEATLHELAEGPFNVNSVPQLRSVLYDRLGLTPLRKTKTGFSTDARTLELLRDQHPIVEVLLRYREVEKLRSTYGESLANEVGPGRSDPRHLPPDGGPHRAPVVGPAQPAQHPGADGAGAAVPPRLRAVPGAAVAGGRLRPGRVAGHRPPVG